MFFNSNWGQFYGVIYKLVDNNTDKSLERKMIYIGQTVQSLKDRFMQHLRDPPNSYFVKALTRYGKKFNVVIIDDDHLITDGGEFSIEVIAKTIDLDDQNAKEVDFIKKHRTCILDYYLIDTNGEIIPQYGYNVNRGGSGRTYLTGIFHYSYKFVDENQLKTLIIEGYTSSELCREFDISFGTLNVKISEFWGNVGISNLTEARLEFRGYDNFKRRIRNNLVIINKKYIDIIRFLECIENGAIIEDLIQEFNVSLRTIYNRLNLLGYSNLTEAIEDLGAYELHKARENEYRENSRARGADLPNYIPVPEESISNFLIDGLNGPQIVDELEKIGIKISVNALYYKIKEFWGLNIKEAGRIFRTFPRIEQYLGKSYIDELINNSTSIEEMDEFYIKKLISIGVSREIVTQLYELSAGSIYGLITECLDINYEYARDLYFWKPWLISTIRNGNSIEEMIQIFSEINAAHTDHAIYGAMFRVWNIEYEEFGRDGRLLHNYLRRIYRTYPNIDKFLSNPIFDSIMNNDYSVKEIDKIFLSYLIYLGIQKNELMEKLELGKKAFNRLFFIIFGARYSEVKDEYFWKKRLIPLLKQRCSTIEMANEIPRTPPQIRETIKRIWKKEFLGFNQDFTALLDYLGDISNQK